MTTKQLLLAMLLFGVSMVAAFLIGMQTDHVLLKADPYCGAGSNYHGGQDVCEPGNPTPSPGYLPYPGPGQGTSNTGGYPNNYGGN